MNDSNTHGVQLLVTLERKIMQPYRPPPQLALRLHSVATCDTTVLRHGVCSVVTCDTGDKEEIFSYMFWIPSEL
ncbi:hypothetical protein M8J77_020050 [Diaphorina citri]|nr:hypothetical protein M8J77_020050 [Diaphorina citri]